MPGGYFQLIAQGPADFYLTGNPSITFFKTVYRRYSTFSMEMITLPYNNIPNFTTMSETECKCKIDRNADLLYDTYVVYDLPAIYNNLNRNIPFQWVENIGNKIIQEVSFKVNGLNIDRQFGEYMQIISDLTLNKSKKEKYDNLINGNNKIINSGLASSKINDQQNNFLYPIIQSKRLYIPLKFWFCDNPGLSVPLISLQYTECRIDVIYTRFNELFKIGNPPLSPVEFFESNNLSADNVMYRDYLSSLQFDQTNVINYFTRSFNVLNTSTISPQGAPTLTQNSTILANYIYLGNDERKKFAQTSHEYLITQVQRRIFKGLTRGPNSLNLVLHHPVKELIWGLRREDAYKRNDWFNFTDSLCPELFNNIKKTRDYITIPCIQNLISNDTTACCGISVTDCSNNSCSNNGLCQEKNLDCSYTEYLGNLNSDFYDESSVSTINSKQWDYYSIMKDAKLIFNGHDRFEIQDRTFFENLQVYKYHTGSSRRGLYVYSFSINPEKEQPSGTCNMSRINEQQLRLNIFETPRYEGQTDKFDLHLYAINYNVFRIMGGIGQIVFSN